MIDNFIGKWRSFAIVIAVLFIGFILTVNESLRFLKNDQDAYSAEIDAKVVEVAKKIENEVNGHLVLIRAMQAYFNANGVTTNNQFYAFADAMRTSQVGAIFQGWALRAPKSELTEIQDIRTELEW